MRFTLTILALAAAIIAAPVPQGTYKDYDSYETPPGGYGSYNNVVTPPVTDPAPPPGGYGNYGNYGKYGSYGTYKKQ